MSRRTFVVRILQLETKASGGQSNKRNAVSLNFKAPSLSAFGSTRVWQARACRAATITNKSRMTQVVPDLCCTSQSLLEANNKQTNKCCL